ncbi:acyl-CoA Delta-9 desaturase-like [Lasioglossum baleicum]|uniref:acyl-CoA Delta-9 desaturase-like n=1 Tax=Lasioglossum baleicum TaxID=434251 RepID=UPI003FCC3DF1
MANNMEPAKKQYIKWGAVLWYIHLHVLGVYALWLMFTSAKWMTVFFTLLITMLGCLGVTVGAHRLWAHKSFEASGSLKLFLMLAHTLAGVGPIYDWVLYHRIHHKFYGTDKDPYNHNKGFIYSHYMGNFQSPKVDYEQAKTEVDMRDLDKDIYVWMQKHFYWLIFGVFGLLLPLNAPLEYWDETMGLTVLITGILRFAITVNVSWLVNSAVIIWGINESQLKAPPNMSTFFIRRNNWPTYHYQLPWDWKCGEFGTYDTGCSTFFVKMWYELGFINNLQAVDPEDVRDLLHEVATKKTTMEEGIAKLKKIAEYNAAKLQLQFR